MTWIDAALVVTLAAITGLAAERRLVGLSVGIGGVLALRPLLALAQLNAWLALVAALLVGLVLALIARHVLPLARVSGTAARVAGGVGGFLLGLALVVALVTSLPIQRNPVEPTLIYYPPRNLPASVQPAVIDSLAVALGRDVLLQPLLAASPTYAEPAWRAQVFAALHRWFVVGEPWLEAGG